MWVLFPLLPILCLAQNSFNITTEDGTLNTIYDVIIIGAGLTGLSAARQISRISPNASILVLEARGQAGGRVRARSMTTINGDEYVDLGSQFIARDHSALLELARELRMTMAPQSMCGERSLLIEGISRHRREVSWSNTLSDRPTFEQLLQSPDTEALSKESIDQFSMASQLSAADAASVNRLLQTLYDAPERTMSALQMAITTASENKTVSELLASSGHGASMLVVGGMYQMVRALADGLNVEFNQKVVGVNQMTSPATVLTSSHSFRGRNILVAVPPIVANGFVYSPPLDLKFKQFLVGYRPTGNAYYFTITYNSAFWRANNKNGQVIHTSSKGPLVWLTTFDVTADVRCTAVSGGTLFGIAHFTSAVEEKDRLQQYVRVVKQSLDAPFNPLDVKDVQLSSDDTARGTMGVLPPGFDLSWLEYFTGVVEQGDKLQFASAEFSNVSTGLMNGAVLAGQQAADLIIDKLSLPRSDPDRNNLLFDQPLREEASNQPFAYSTSTHYPPTTTPDIHIVLAPAVLHEASRDQTVFAYSTSTQYPTQQPAVQRDSGSSTFRYETSSQYPPTTPIETTTYKHFSFGNANQEAEEIDPYGNSIQDQAVEGAGADQGFVYHTSTQYPSTERLETSTFKHFSFGNLEEDVEEEDDEDEEGPAKMIATPPPQEKPQADDSSASGFLYSTSTIIPPMPSVSTTTMRHFSNGNAPQLNEETAQVVAALPPGQQPSPSTDLQLQNPSANAVSGQILNDLRQVVDQAPSSDQLTLATRLNAIVLRILQSLNGSTR